MRKIAVVCFALAVAQGSWAAEFSRSFGTLTGGRFVIAARTNIDDAVIAKSGCRIVRRDALDSGVAALVECSASADALVAIATERKWIIRTATKYKNLDLRDSMLLALSALINPESITRKKMSYFFPAKGETVEQRQEWLDRILRKNNSAVSLIVSERQGTYFGFTPATVNPAKFLKNVNADYGVSVGSEDLPAFLSLNPNERGNAQRIVGE